MRATVRFRDSVPRHGHKIPGLSHSGWDGNPARVAGQEVVIELPPVPPHHPWDCGAEMVWRIPDDEVARLTGAYPPAGHVVVCEHQIDVD